MFLKYNYLENDEKMWIILKYEILFRMDIV